MSVTWAVLSSVPRCVLTSWSTAKRCCCRAQPRPSSASASSAPLAVSQQAGMEAAQVSHILPIVKKRKGSRAVVNVHKQAKLFCFVPVLVTHIFQFSPCHWLKSDVSFSKTRIFLGPLSFTSSTSSLLQVWDWTPYFLCRSLFHPAINGLFPRPQPRPGAIPAEEQCCWFLPVPPESQTEPEQAAEPGSAASWGAQGGNDGPTHQFTLSHTQHPAVHIQQTLFVLLCRFYKLVNKTYLCFI